jgi:hypothetical protein
MRQDLPDQATLFDTGNDPRLSPTIRVSLDAVHAWPFSRGLVEAMQNHLAELGTLGIRNQAMIQFRFLASSGTPLAPRLFIAACSG